MSGPPLSRHAHRRDRALWSKVLFEVKGEVFSDHLLMAAARIAHALFGLVSAVAAVATVWRLAVGAQPMEQLVETLPP
ncbi:MAG TPA: hypothetical protein VGN75_05195 [Kaistia sp.]|jgi:hypothetical protein|nr:hypothetical protein [Kaistia sp.]